MFNHVSKTNKVSLIGTTIVFAALAVYVFMQGGSKADTNPVATSGSTGSLVINAKGTFAATGTKTIGNISIKDSSGKEYASSGAKLTESNPTYTQTGLPTNNPTFYTIALTSVDASFTVDDNPRQGQWVYSDHTESTAFTVRSKCPTTCGTVVVNVEDITNPFVDVRYSSVGMSIRKTDTAGTVIGHVMATGVKKNLTKPNLYSYTFTDVPVGQYKIGAGGVIIYYYEMNPTVSNNTGENRGWSRLLDVKSGATSTVTYSVAQTMDAANPSDLTVKLLGDGIDKNGTAAIADVVVIKPTGERIVKTIKESADLSTLAYTTSLPSSSGLFPEIAGYQVKLENINPKYKLQVKAGNTNPRTNVKLTTGQDRVVSFVLERAQ